MAREHGTETEGRIIVCSMSKRMNSNNYFLICLDYIFLIKFLYSNKGHVFFVFYDTTFRSPAKVRLCRWFGSEVICSSSSLSWSSDHYCIRHCLIILNTAGGVSIRIVCLIARIIRRLVCIGFD